MNKTDKLFYTEKILQNDKSHIIDIAKNLKNEIDMMITTEEINENLILKYSSNYESAIRKYIKTKTEYELLKKINTNS